MRRAWCLLLPVMLAACGEEAPAPPQERIAYWKDRGDRAFENRGWDESTDERRWEAAIGAYRNVFALVDPVPARAGDRAMLAFRIGRSRVELARIATDPSRVASLSRFARIWLREALALRPALHHVWFERAQLLELERAHPARDRELAQAYRAFVDGTESGQPAKGEEVAKRLRLAKTRLKELGL